MLVVEESSALRISRYGETLLLAESDGNGSYYRSWREDGGLRVDFYGMPEPKDPTLRRSAVSVTFHFSGETATLITGVSAAHSVSFRLRPGRGGRISFFDRLFSDSGGIPCVKMTAPSGNSLYMAYDGDIRFDDETETLCFDRGQGRLLFLCPDEEVDRDALIRLFRTACPPIFGRRMPEQRFLARSYARRRCVLGALAPIGEEQGLLRHLVAEMREELYARQSVLGGLSLGEEPTPLAEQARTALFFCADGNRRQADAFLGYLRYLLRRYGRLPDVCMANGEGARFGGDAFGEVPMTVLSVLMSYTARFGRPETSLFDLVKWAGDRALRALRNGSLPVGNDGAFPSYYRFAGSAKATLLFLAAERFAIGLLPAAPKGITFRIGSALSFTESSFLSRFSDGKSFFLTDPLREKEMHHPHTLMGRCDFCQGLGSLTRKGRAYYHSDCGRQAEEVTTCLQRIPDDRKQIALMDACFGVGLVPPPLWEELPPLAERTVEELALSAVASCFDEEQRRSARTCLLERYEWERASLSERAPVLAACAAKPLPRRVKMNGKNEKITEKEAYKRC